MTPKQEEKYAESQKLKSFIEKFPQKKFKLDCGHHVTLSHPFGNSLAIINGKNLKIICLDCAR